VILGAGTGGALTANLLCRRLDPHEWTITVVDRGALHVYRPGLLFDGECESPPAADGRRFA
jgi:sulfide:quinone oxidoreductase